MGGTDKHDGFTAVTTRGDVECATLEEAMSQTGLLRIHTDDGVLMLEGSGWRWIQYVKFRMGRDG